jgi:hypothetical protein
MQTEQKSQTGTQFLIWINKVFKEPLKKVINLLPLHQS